MYISHFCYTTLYTGGYLKIIIKKIGISLIGVPILILGIILIPLPGPGILVTLLGLYILSFAFESLKPHLEKYKKMAMNIIDKAKEKQNAVLEKDKKKPKTD